MSQRPPESEARRVLVIMLGLTFVIGLLTLLVPGDTTTKSVILIAWIAVMMAVLRRYHLEPPEDGGRGPRSRR